MFLLIALLASPAFGQVICKDGKCQLANEWSSHRFKRKFSLIRVRECKHATTESMRIDSIIGLFVQPYRDCQRCLWKRDRRWSRRRWLTRVVLTNAHVAGTQKGRIVELERRNQDGTSEKGQGAVIASGYGRECLSTLHCSSATPISPSWSEVPIPLADRFPKTDGGVTTFGCPRCEWPSMQVLSSIGRGTDPYLETGSIGGDRVRASSIYTKQVHALLDF